MIILDDSLIYKDMSSKSVKKEKYIKIGFLAVETSQVHNQASTKCSSFEISKIKELNLEIKLRNKALIAQTACRLERNQNSYIFNGDANFEKLFTAYNQQQQEDKDTCLIIFELQVINKDEKPENLFFTKKLMLTTITDIDKITNISILLIDLLDYPDQMIIKFFSLTEKEGTVNYHETELFNTRSVIVDFEFIKNISEKLPLILYNLNSICSFPYSSSFDCYDNGKNNLTQLNFFIYYLKLSGKISLKRLRIFYSYTVKNIK